MSDNSHEPEEIPAGIYKRPPVSPAEQSLRGIEWFEYGRVIQDNVTVRRPYPPQNPKRDLPVKENIVRDVFIRVCRAKLFVQKAISQIVNAPRRAWEPRKTETVCENAVKEADEKFENLLIVAESAVIIMEKKCHDFKLYQYTLRFLWFMEAFHPDTLETNRPHLTPNSPVVELPIEVCKMIWKQLV